MKTLFSHPADDDFAAAVVSDLRASGRFLFELFAILAAVIFGGALIVFAG